MYVLMAKSQFIIVILIESKTHTNKLCTYVNEIFRDGNKV